MLPPILLANVFAGCHDNGVVTKASMNRTGPVSLMSILHRHGIEKISGSFKFYEDKDIAIWYVFGVELDCAMIHELTHYGVHLFIIFPDKYDKGDVDDEELFMMFYSCISNICKYAYPSTSNKFVKAIPSLNKYVDDLMEEEFERDINLYVKCNIYRLTRRCEKEDRKVLETIEGKYFNFITKNINEFGKSRMFW